ncbi:MAG: nuclear transport factor 2 family protein, partial [Alphaproteobacteria bacterium]|nr:nuclear transport factor 2 family protein [Alphaproteobacteria bacterium]
FHSLSNEYYQVDGDRGVGETYVIGISTAEADGQKMDGMVGGRYLDKFERRKGVWRSSHRLFVMDWNMNFPATAEWEEGMYGQIRTHGQRDHSDPVFKLWESLT